MSKEEYLKRIKEAKSELESGGGTELKSHKDIDDFLDSL